MKKLVSLVLSGVLALGLALPAFATPRTWNLMSDGEQPYYTAADEAFDMTGVRDGGDWPLLNPLYTDGISSGSVSVVVRCENNANLSAEVLTGDVKTHVSMLRRRDETSRHEYTFYLLSISPDRTDGSTATEKFSIALKSRDTTVTLHGSTETCVTQYVVSEAEYRIRNGFMFEFVEELYAPATISGAQESIVLSLPKGEYGNEIHSLALNTAPPSALPEVLASYNFVDSPTFEREVTVKIKTQPGERVRELTKTRQSKLDGEYRDGYFQFKTDTLGHYIVYPPA